MARQAFSGHYTLVVNSRVTHKAADTTVPKKKIVEDIRFRYGLSKRQTKDRLAALKINLLQAANITRLVEVAFPALASADR